MIKNFSKPFYMFKSKVLIMTSKNITNHLNFNQVELIVENEKEGFSKPQVIVIFVFGEQETTHRQTIQKVHRNPIVWRGNYINVTQDEYGHLQPHFRKLNLADKHEGDLIPYCVHAELYQAQKDLKVNLVEGSGLDFSQREC